MKKYYYILFSFFIGVLIIYSYKVNAHLPLIGKIIVIDPGHGMEDKGTSYKNIYEKDINLSISKELEKYLTKLGATVILTRDDDYDLSKPNAKRRKKSDFDNRIRLINNSNANLYISIHQNYLNNNIYRGPQVFFYNDNDGLASIIQYNLNKRLNSKRNIKRIPNNTYMYSKLKIRGVLIECGFISNKYERSKLIDENYQKEIAIAISQGILEYFQY